VVIRLIRVQINHFGQPRLVTQRSVKGAPATSLAEPINDIARLGDVVDVDHVWSLEEIVGLLP
jgi:hypothetical protein